MWQLSNEHIDQLLDLTVEYFIHEILLSLSFMTPCFPVFLLPFWIILSRLFPFYFIDTYWSILRSCSQTAFLLSLYVCSHGYLIHFLELNMTPPVPMTTKFMSLSQKVTEVQLCISTLVWMSCGHLKCKVAKLNSAFFPHTLPPTLLFPQRFPFQYITWMHPHQKHPINLFSPVCLLSLNLSHFMTTVSLEHISFSPSPLTFLSEL